MSTDTPTIQPPPPPGDPDAWYAPDVVAQYAVAPGVVATVRDVRETTAAAHHERTAGGDDGSTADDDGAVAGDDRAPGADPPPTDAPFRYETREPALCVDGHHAFERIDDHFDGGQHRRPLTRAGVVERAREGFEPKYARALDRLVDATPELRRRLDYHALRAFRLLGDATPLALDERIAVADAAGDELVVHTDAFAPAATGTSVSDPFVDRVASERLQAYHVSFAEFSVPVVVYRDHLLGDDSFSTRYAVREPPLLPGDEALIAACKDRLWETTVDGVVDDRYAFVAGRAREFLSRRLTARNTRAWLDAASDRLREALAAYGVGVPPVDSRYARDRLDDLVYYVLRDFVGEGVLTVPLRDEHLEDVEANAVDERVKVVPRESVLAGATTDERVASPDDPARAVASRDESPTAVGRVPTNLRFETESQFVNVVTQLAARDGTELDASTPSAKVNLDLPNVDSTARCAVALPVVSEDGPHLSVRKQAAEPMTPVELVDRGALSTELVTLLWLLYEHRGVVLFSGPTGVGKTTLLNAHVPFVPFDDRPVSIDEGSREVELPHETGVSLTTRDHEQPYKRVSMADLMTEANYLNPDVEVIAEINSPASFQTFGEVLNTGHGVLGTTHAEDVSTLVNRVVEQGLPAYLLGEIDLVVFPRQVDGERYVSEAVELAADPTAFADCDAPGGVVEAAGGRIAWNRVAARTPDGSFSFAYDHPELGDGTRRLAHRVFHRLGDTTDRTVREVESEFHRKHRYVRHLRREGVTDFRETFEFLADLRVDEAATVDRVRQSTGTATRARGGADD
ncbi:type II/IV secretion system ATPase subunit [Halobaculum sp. MBLA0147]|uniref:type II/IV secretion system ATPase subunit n=1 Tax=Halobaculum sp. MBLA0147 TaxID=3079934 RepID=UPI0035245AF2